MSRKWHPDKSDSPDANKMMMKINEAYRMICASFEDGSNEVGSDDDDNDEWEDEANHGSNFENSPEFMHMMMEMMRQMQGGRMPPGMGFSFGPGGPGGMPGRSRQKSGHQKQQEEEARIRMRKKAEEEVSSHS
jgi:DnaJ-class molecular chaperone